MMAVETVGGSDRDSEWLMTGTERKDNKRQAKRKRNCPMNDFNNVGINPDPRIHRHVAQGGSAKDSLSQHAPSVVHSGRLLIAAEPRVFLPRVLAVFASAIGPPIVSGLVRSASIVDVRLDRLGELVAIAVV